jgi:hypothetical protein
LRAVIAISVFGLLIVLACVGGGVASVGAESDDAGTGTQLQSCVDKALSSLTIRTGAYTIMIYPGDRRKQITESAAMLRPVPTECLTLVERKTPQAYFKMQRPDNHRQWIRTKPRSLTNEEGNAPFEGNDEGGEGTIFVYAPGGGKGRTKDRRFLYRCTPGKSVTHVWVVYRLKVASVGGGDIIGRKSYTAAVKILPVPHYDPVQGGGVGKRC